MTNGSLMKVESIAEGSLSKMATLKKTENWFSRPIIT